MRYWDADNPTETEVDLTFRFYGWTYFRFETWEVGWKGSNGTSKFYGVKIYKLRFLTEIVSS